MMIRVMRLLSRSRVRILAAGGGGGGEHCSSTVNPNNRRWASSSSSVPPLSSELSKEAYNGRNSSTTVDDASTDEEIIDFIMEVKNVFQDEPEKMYEFMTLLGHFRVGRIDLSVVKEGMKELFKEHNNLIWKFNNFLPPGEIPVPLDDDGLPFKYDSTAFRDYQE